MLEKSESFERAHEGQGYAIRNESRDAILDLQQHKNLIVMNTWFKKINSHLIIFKSETNSNQINFSIT